MAHIDMNKLGIKKSLTWMGVTSFLGQIITWSSTIIVARILTPSDYGIVAISGLFTLFAQTVSEMGLGAAVIQRDKISLLQIRNLYTLSIIVGLLMTFIGIAFAPLMSYIFNDNRLTSLVAFQSLIFFIISIKSMQKNILVREVRFDLIAKVETVSRVITSACTIILASLGFGYWALAAQWLIIEFIQFIIFSKIKKIKPSLSLNFKKSKEVLIFGIKIMLRNIVGQIYSLADTAILGKLTSQSFLGAYTFSKNLTNMPFEKVIRIINQVLFPYLSQKQNNLDSLHKITSKVGNFQAILIAPLFILLFFCASETVNILLGSDWNEAVFPLRVFCVANLFKLSESYNINCLTAIGKIREQISFYIVLSILIVCGMLILYYLFDAKASILVWVTVYPVLNIHFCYTMLKAINVRIIDAFKALLPIFMSQIVLVLYLLVYNFYSIENSWITLIFKIISGLIVYGLSLFIFAKKQFKNVAFEFIRKNDYRN
jgi:O-antigen/teichoic acid export membrane protein